MLLLRRMVVRAALVAVVHSHMRSCWAEGFTRMVDFERHVCCLPAETIAICLIRLAGELWLTAACTVDWWWRWRCGSSSKTRRDMPPCRCMVRMCCQDGPCQLAQTQGLFMMYHVKRTTHRYHTPQCCDELAIARYVSLNILADA